MCVYSIHLHPHAFPIHQQEQHLNGFDTSSQGQHTVLYVCIFHKFTSSYISHVPTGTSLNGFDMLSQGQHTVLYVHIFHRFTYTYIYVYIHSHTFHLISIGTTSQRSGYVIFHWNTQFIQYIFFFFFHPHKFFLTSTREKITTSTVRHFHSKCTF